jgi:hypothetical protein
VGHTWHLLGRGGDLVQTPTGYGKSPFPSREECLDLVEENTRCKDMRLQSHAPPLGGGLNTDSHGAMVLIASYNGRSIASRFLVFATGWQTR